MTDAQYLIVMAGVVTLTTVVTLPALLFKRCSVCGRRSLVDSKHCRACGAVFPEEPDDG